MNENKKTATAILMLVVGMFAFAFAAFPLYSIFCKVTGYGGTPRIESAESHTLGKKIITVRFNADISNEIGWDFKPVQKQLNVQTGENKLAFFMAKNISNNATTGVATFNVTPNEAGKYFNKIQCFCFERQTLKPGEEVQMPVSFFVDPAIEQDLDVKDINTITLSYTFFKAVD